ncbi:hypothetical protein P885DRAFT_37061, partial [Corynascus similis CBS 632.67]
QQCGAKRGDHDRGLVHHRPASMLHSRSPRRAMPVLTGDADLDPGVGARSPCAKSLTAIRWPPRRRRTHAASTLVMAALGLARGVSAEPILPYMPTTILLPPDGAVGSGTAYIFTPSGDDRRDAVDFLALNISSLRNSALEPTKLTSELPFLSKNVGNCATFVPSLLHNGTIAVVAGDCSSSATSTLWTYTPGSPGAAWTQYPVAPSASWDNAQAGPYHLSGIISFSPQLSPILSEPTIYLYGGMCPRSSSSRTTAATWQSDAAYSNRMLRLTPPPSSKGKDKNENGKGDGVPYALEYAPTRGQQPPVAEAGFTLTELAPSLSNRTIANTGDDKGDDGQTATASIVITTQKTSHVLLGGHTQDAFVNMSTAAVWSLPEETWSFVSIAPPPHRSSLEDDDDAGGGRTDLARHQRGWDKKKRRYKEKEKMRRESDAAAPSVDSRSGHTAVLSEDGTRLVVYGGWVGDVGQAAEPQLAVVRVGVGLGDWEWEIPTEQGSAATTPSSGRGGGGIYGHGAVVLPGNVMMVYGGYEISGSGGEVKKRSGGSMFYNITSGSWADVYVSPLAQGNNGGSGSGSGTDGSGSTHGGGGSDGSGSDGSAESGYGSGDSRARQIGLGVGLGVGLLVLSILACVGIRWFRRRQQRRAARDETLRSLSQGVTGALAPGAREDDEMLEKDHGMGMFPWTAAAARNWYMGGDDPYAQGRRSLGYETLRGGGSRPHSLYIPPPPSASTFSHRPKAAKGLHQPSSSYDFTPLTRTPNRIEPIYEADEDSDGDLGKGYPLSPDREERVGDDNDNDNEDPFLTPTTHTPTGGAFPRTATGNSSPRNSGSPTPTIHQPQNQPLQAESTRTGAGGVVGGGHAQHPDVQGWVHDVHDIAIASGTASAPLAPPSPSPSSHSGGKPPTTPTTITAVAGGRRLSPLRRGASTRSSRSGVGAASSVTTDDGRTASNLSEHSAFSIVPGSAGGDGSGRAPGVAGSSGSTAGPEDRVLLSRLRTTLATTTATSSGGDGRLGSSSSSSGGSYNTARSSFAALQAEGPGLLLGRRRRRGEEEAEGAGEEEEEEGDYVYVPGSPSKSKPRRSWFGSLKRVFSGGTPESGSNASGSNSLREDSPTREGLLSWGEKGGSSDYDGGLYGVGLQQRRRQGREAWLGGNANLGDEEDWERDLERAAAQRTVQIMFTVPKEPLRVVNAEVEREESVLIVDPEDDDYRTDEKSSLAPGEGPSRKQTPEPNPEPTSAPGLALPAENKERGAERLSTATLEPPAGLSPSPSLRAASIGSTTLQTAEAVRLERPERPRTRVLEMVESFESRSREGSRESSPTGSPVRKS